jgi:phospholipid transport system substrate-binding protein
VLLSVMKDADQLGILGRYKKLEPVLSQVFSLKSMIQIASGSFWKRTSDQEKTQLTSAFSRLTIATYATQFDGFSGQLFKTIGTKPGPQKTTLVETQIVNPDTSSVTLRYVFREIKGQWRVIDVLLDTGFSELARKRSEYRSVLKTVGVAGLTLLLNAKTDSLLAN